MKTIISLEISRAGYSETQRHVPEKQSLHLQIRMLNISPIRKTIEILDSAQEKKLILQKLDGVLCFP